MEFFIHLIKTVHFRIHVLFKVAKQGSSFSIPLSVQGLVEILASDRRGGLLCLR